MFPNTAETSKAPVLLLEVLLSSLSQTEHLRVTISFLSSILEVNRYSYECSSLFRTSPHELHFFQWKSSSLM